MSHLEPDVIETAAKEAPVGEVAAHLQSCAQCREDVRRAKGRQRLLAGMTPYTLADVAFRRVEARLDEAVESGALTPSPLKWLAVALAGAVVASLGLVLIARDEPLTQDLPAAPVQVAAAAFHPLTVLQVQDAQRRDGAAWAALSVGDVVADGDAVSAKRLLLAPDDAVAWAFEASGSLSFGGAASLTLGAGQVAARVAAPVDVLAATRRFHAVDARFSVTRAGAEVVLHVAEGEVEVFDTESSARLVVKAPASLRWSDGTPLTSHRTEADTTVADVQVPARPWVRFETGALADGTVVSLDGARVGTAPFTALVTAGRRELSLSPPGTTSWVELIGGQPFTPSVAPVEAPREGPEPDAAALRRVMDELTRQKPKFAVCYEKWLKANRAAQADVTLTLEVTAKGRVRSAQVQERQVDRGAGECLVRTAKSLALPPLGVDATLELPLLLRAQ